VVQCAGIGEGVRSSRKRAAAAGTEHAAAGGPRCLLGFALVGGRRWATPAQRCACWAVGKQRLRSPRNQLVATLHHPSLYPPPSPTLPQPSPPHPKHTQQFAAPLLTTLHAMHAAGVIHRDIKLENILLDERGRPCLGDFDLAVFAHSPPARSPVGTVRLGLVLLLAVGACGFGLIDYMG